MTTGDDGATATGGMSGITEDAPGHAGAPGGPGSVDGVSGAGADPETYDVSGNAAETFDPPGETAGDGETSLDNEGLVTGNQGGVTGTGDL